MSQVYPLDRVIRRVTADYTTFEPAERIVIIDAKRRSIVPKKPFFSFADLRYYVLLTSNDARNVATGQINGFQLQDLLYALPVSLAYEVRCKPGNEMRVALALFDDFATPGEILERAIARWLVELGQMGIPELVRAYLRDKTALESKIASKALIEIGLELNARLFLDYERSLEPIAVTKDHFLITASDYPDEEQDLSIRITLDVDETWKANAILAYRLNGELHDLVPKEVVKFFRENVTLQSFCTQLNAQEVRDGLARHLDRVLTPYGRKVGGVRLESDAPPLLFFFQKLVPVQCRLHEYPEDVVISNEVQMILRDVRQYRAANAPDLTDWLQKKLRQVIPQLLFGVKYIDVLIRFAPFESEIKRILSEQAAAIGYEIKQLITIPDLEPIRLKDAFTINASGTFELRLANFFVRLQVICTTRIPRLETIENQLNRLQNVPKLMEDAVVTLTRQYLHGIEPERFYMRFGFTEVVGERPVEQELVGRIQEKLNGDFGAEVIDVIVKVGDTEIITRLRNLQKTICPFKVDIASLHPSENTVVEGNFQVDMVDGLGWSRFQQLTIGLEDIAHLLEEHLYATLQAAKPELIQFRDPRHHKKFEILIAGLAMQYMREQFGLVVRVTNVRRQRTLTEEATTRALIAESDLVLTQRVEALKAWKASEERSSKEKLDRLDVQLKQRLAASDAADHEVAELERRVRETRESLAPAGIPTFGDVQAGLVPRRSKDLTLDDLWKLAGLPDDSEPGPDTRPQGEPE
jgi:hypothetical protein